MRKNLLILMLSLVSIGINAQSPVITSFNPVSGAVGTLITIVGTNLNGVTTFTVGGTNAIVVSDSSTKLVGLVMPGSITGPIVIKTTGGNVTSSSNFTVTATSFPSQQQGNKLVGTGATGPANQGSSAISSDGNTAIVGGYYDNSGVGAAWIYTRSGSTWSQQGNKLVGTGAVGLANQGMSVALSSDGNTAIVGGWRDNNNVGAVWIYTRNAGVWSQQGSKLVGTGAIGQSRQGEVKLSSDGNTAIVGGPGDNNYTGAVWVFVRSGGVWNQQGSKLVGTGAIGAADQGNAVALSSDGNTILVGGNYDNTNIGAVWVYTLTNGVWTQQGNKLVGSGAIGGANQGSVAISSDGNTALVGGYNDNNNTGAVWIFTGTGGVWTQQGNKLVGTGAIGAAGQGGPIALSSDGNTAMVGGPKDNNNSGAVWVFTRTGGAWMQQGSKLVGTGAINGTYGAYQGQTIALSTDGNTAIVGGPYDNNNVGAVWVFAALPPTVTSVNVQNSASALINLTVNPNPLSSQGSITYFIEHDAMVQLSLIDLQGRKIKIIANDIQHGLVKKSFDLTDTQLPDGVYLINLNIDGKSYTKPVIIDK
jgi:hypothetical protein